MPNTDLVFVYIQCGDFNLAGDQRHEDVFDLETNCPSKFSLLYFNVAEKAEFYMNLQQEEKGIRGMSGKNKDHFVLVLLTLMLRTAVI